MMEGLDFPERIQKNQRVFNEAGTRPWPEFEKMKNQRKKSPKEPRLLAVELTGDRRV